LVNAGSPGRLDGRPGFVFFNKILMKKLLLILTLFLAGGASSSMAAEKDPKFEEGISFEIETIPLEHQGPNVVDIKVTFTYVPGLAAKEYPDFIPLYTMATTFLKEYPAKDDYWEVVIKKLSMAYLEKDKAIASARIDLNVYPTKTVPYYHVVTCTASR